jgi:hypothetical protein
MFLNLRFRSSPFQPSVENDHKRRRKPGVENVGPVTNRSFRLFQTLLQPFARQKRFPARHTTPEFDVPTKAGAKSSNLSNFRATSYKLFRAELPGKMRGEFSSRIKSKAISRISSILHEPLLGQKRLDDGFAAFANGQNDFVIFNFFQQTEFFKSFDDQIRALCIGPNLQNPRPPPRSSSRRRSSR